MIKASCGSVSEHGRSNPLKRVNERRLAFGNIERRREGLQN